MDRRQARAALLVVFAASVLVGLNATMLSVALPEAVGDLRATPAQGTWMLLSYLVVSGSGLVLSGQLADSFDLGTIFRSGLVVFGLSALVLMLSNDPVAFIAARAVQGAGAALLLSTAAAIIAVSHGPETRRHAMGVYLAGFSVAQVCGPIIGGLVASTVGWRWLFAISCAFALGSLVLGWRPLAALPSRPFAGMRIDVAGNVLILVMTSLLVVAFAGVQRVGWTNVATIAPLVVVALTVPVFVLVEHRVAWPAVAVDLLKDRDFALANAAAFCFCVGRVVPGVVLSLWFQGLSGDGPLAAALRITPLAVAVTVGTLAVGRVFASGDDVLASRATGALAVLGSGVLAAAMAAGGGTPGIVLGLVLIGLATGGFQTPNSTMIIAMRPVARAGTVNGVRVTVQQSAVSLGTALLLSLGTAGLSTQSAADFYAGRAELLDAPARAAVVAGHVTSFSVLFGLSVVGFVAVLLLRRPRHSMERN